MVTFVPGFLNEECAGLDRRDDRVQRARSPSSTPATAPSTSAAEQAWLRANPRPPCAVSDAADHVEHVREVAGVDCVGLGGDFDGVAALPDGLERRGRLPAAAGRAGRTRLVRRRPGQAHLAQRAAGAARHRERRPGRPAEPRARPPRPSPTWTGRSTRGRPTPGRSPDFLLGRVMLLTGGSSAARRAPRRAALGELARRRRGRARCTTARIVLPFGERLLGDRGRLVVAQVPVQRRDDGGRALGVRPGHLDVRDQPGHARSANSTARPRPAAGSTPAGCGPSPAASRSARSRPATRRTPPPRRCRSPGRRPAAPPRTRPGSPCPA